MKWVCVWWGGGGRHSRTVEGQTLCDSTKKLGTKFILLRWNVFDIHCVLENNIDWSFAVVLLFGCARRLEKLKLEMSVSCVCGFKESGSALRLVCMHSDTAIRNTFGCKIFCCLCLRIQSSFSLVFRNKVTYLVATVVCYDRMLEHSR